MSFFKQTTIKLDPDDIEVIEPSLIKTAAFKLPDGVQYDPDFLYMWVKGVSAGEVWGANKNDDWFPRQELKESYKTFLTAHVFKNHENKDIKNAIGDVLLAIYDDDMDCVKLLIRVDSKIAPSIVRGFQKGYMTDVSMGCRVTHSVCSICGNVAKVPAQYCEHVKFQRGKIFDDGRKVYEINIGPKFHDISTVLNGAEKTAKVTGIYVCTDKLAGIEEGDKMQKVAGTHNDSVMSMLYQFEAYKQAAPIVADTSVIMSDLFNQSLTKEAYAHKVAELSKDIEARIMNISEDRINEDLVENSDSARNILRLVCEEYWDEEKCHTIAEMLKHMAEERNDTLESVLAQFLNTLTFTGCELAPKEFQTILSDLFNMGLDADTSGEDYNYTDEDENEFAECKSEIPELRDASFFDMLHPAIEASKIEDSFSNISSEHKSPIRGIAMISVMPNREENHYMSNSSIPDILLRLGDLIRDRSIFSPTMVKRASAENDNKEFFITKQASPKNDIANALYMSYQNDRVNMFGSSQYDKIATEYAENQMEKVAFKYSRAKALTLGMPLTFGYSNLQRSRIDNGENVSSINKMVAENPANTYLLQAILAPKAFKHLGKGISSAKKMGRNTLRSAEEMSSKVKLSFDCRNDLEKRAEYTGKVFKSSVVDDALKSVYNDTQVKALKIASVMSAFGHDDAATLILKANSMNGDEVYKYAEIAVDALVKDKKDNFIKDAEFFKEASINKIPDNMEFEKVVFYKIINKI